MKKNKGLIFAIEIDGKIAAFMHGYINLKDKSYEMPRIAIDEKYGFYSPGMLLVEFTIKYLDENTDIRNLNLCRGTEDYKLKMGGVVYQTYNLTLDLK